jgi:hypothetical protein
LSDLHSLYLLSKQQKSGKSHYKDDTNQNHQNNTVKHDDSNPLPAPNETYKTPNRLSQETISAKHIREAAPMYSL